MSFTVTLYEFQKRHNSTRRPQGADIPYTGVLREPSSLITPKIAFEFDPDASPMSNSWGLHFNYAYIAKFARYYWITDWTYDGGLWVASMKVDVLATYRPQILAADAYVAYDQSANTDLVDRRLSMLTAKTIDHRTAMFSKLGQGTSGGGVVIVMCTGQASTAAFAMLPSDISTLMNNIVAWGNATFLDPSALYPGSPNDTFGEALWNYLKGQSEWWKRVMINIVSNGDASENIRAAVQLPLDVADISGTTQEIYLGQYRSNVYAKRVTSRILYDECQVQIPWRYTDWRMNEPYTEIFLYIPYVGNIKMSNSVLVGETDLKVKAMVDLMSGDAIFTVHIVPSNELIASYSVNIGAGYPIGVSNISPVQSLTGVGAALGSLTAGTALSGVAGGALGAVNGIIAANTPNSSSVGGGGGGATQGLLGTCIVTVIAHNTDPLPTDLDADDIMGTPTMKVKSLANVRGYLETRGAAISGNMTATEHAELNALLDSGVYVEMEI